MSHLLVCLLVFSPAPIPLTRQAPPQLWQALKDIALRLEIVGPHERWIDDFSSEVGYVRRHRLELRLAPPLGDAARFPRESLDPSRALAGNRAFTHYLHNRAATHLWQAEVYQHMLCETRDLRLVWECINIATNPDQAWLCRRRALLQLREMLGEAAYYAGRLPPPVPLWHFLTP